jgi:signal transduction histidine kinase
LTRLGDAESLPRQIEKQGETSVIKGVKEVEALVYEFLEKSNKTYLKALSDERAPKNIPQVLRLIRGMFAANSNFRFQLITDLQSTNLNYCKQLLDAGVEVRHIEGNKVSFAISQDEYIAVPINALEDLIATGAEIPNEIVWSTRQDLVSQAEQIFEVMWRSAVPAELRIREIQEGRPRFETKIIREPMEVLAETKRMALASKVYSVSSVPGGLLYAYNYTFEDFKSILERVRKGDHEGIRWVTHIDESCVDVVKKFLELGMDIRDVEKVPTESFGFSEKEVGVTLSRLEGGELSSSALFSNDPMYIDHYSLVFQDLWENGIDARKRIREIELGIAEPELKIIRNPHQIQSLYLQLVREAKDEILLILPSANAYTREVKIGVIEAMRYAAAEKKVRVRMLAPETSTKDGKVDDPINVKKIPEVRAPNTVTLLLIDKTSSLVVELQDDSKLDFHEAIGLATYSTRSSIVRANIRFFDQLWEAESLLENERRSRKEAELLRDILTHDIRNYNQTARMGTGFLLENLRGKTELEVVASTVIEAIDGSTGLVDKAKKLGMILSTSGRTLGPINLIDSIDRSLLVVKSSHPMKLIKETRKIISLDGFPPGQVRVVADDLLDEIFVNIFSNAVKFTPGTNVPLDISIEEKKSNENKGNTYWQITISDYGKGISSHDLQSIFQRYSESYKGTGLGLSIVQALAKLYGGEVGARNRTDGHTGARFEVKLRKA